MSRSFIAGSVAGLAFSAVGLTVTSLISPLSDRPADVLASAAEPAVAPEPAPAPEPVAEAPKADAATAAGADPETAILDVPQGTEFDRPKEDAAAAVPAPDPAPAPPETAAAAPSSEGEAAPATIETATAAAPQGTATAPAPALAPAETATEPLPAAPAGMAETAPAQPAAPALPAATDDSGAARISGAGAEGSARSSLPPPEPSIAAADQPEPEAAPIAPAADPAPDSDTAAGIALPAPDDGPTSDETASTEKPRVLTLDPAAPKAEAPPAMPGGAVPGVNILRLPGTDAAPATLDADAADPAKTAPLPPRKAFAARWQNPDEKPVLGVLILDLGTAAGGLDPSALAALPFPVTIAVDPMAAEAAAAAAAYRSAGDEVAILVGNEPQGATPADFEVAYQSFVQTLPQTVAVIGTPDAAFLRSNLSAQHLAALLAADGRALVTYDQGLNSGRRAAEKAGVPVATINKLFGAGEANMGTLGRELDRAAFTAGQKGQFVIALPSTPDAVTALIAWATGPSGSAVALAPVTAVMGEP